MSWRESGVAPILTKGTWAQIQFYAQAWVVSRVLLNEQSWIFAWSWYGNVIGLIRGPEHEYLHVIRGPQNERSMSSTCRYKGISPKKMGLRRVWKGDGAINVHWRKSTDEREGKPKQKFDATFRTILRISKFSQRRKTKNNYFSL